MKLLKTIDVLGTPFQFTTQKKRKFKTTFGGFISIISFGILITFTMIFGRNFFYRENPQVISKVATPETYPPLIKLTGENLVLPWRIEDVNGVTLNTDGLIYPIWTYKHFEKNKATGDLETVSIRQMKTEKCDKNNANVKEFYNNYNLTNFFCLNTNADEYLFGGYWDADFIANLLLTINYCPEGKPYNEKNNCTNLSDLQKAFYSTAYYFSIYYPSYSFDPDDLDFPLKIHYNLYSYRLDFQMQKIDRMYFREGVVNDDKGWIVVDQTTYSEFGLSKQTNDFILFDLNSYNKTGTMSSFYSLFVYFDKNYEKFNRSYMKFQDLAAIVGGFMKIILVLAEVINYLINRHLRNEFLLNEIFEFNSESDNVDISGNNKK
jgi:hypothetical protein